MPAPARRWSRARPAEDSVRRAFPVRAHPHPSRGSSRPPRGSSYTTAAAWLVGHRGRLQPRHVPARGPADDHVGGLGLERDPGGCGGGGGCGRGFAGPRLRRAPVADSAKLTTRPEAGSRCRTSSTRSRNMRRLTGNRVCFAQLLPTPPDPRPGGVPSSTEGPFLFAGARCVEAPCRRGWPHALPRAAQARAGMMNGPLPSSSRQRSRRASWRSAGSVAT